MIARFTTATHLRYAAGYLVFGLHAEADAELAAIAPADGTALPVLALRAQVCAVAKDWAGAAALGETLCQRDPSDADNWIQWAYAVRRRTDIPAARAILLNARTLHPNEAIIHFNLACYEAQLGNLPTAQEHLNTACKLLPECREMALEDADLLPLHAWIATTRP